jgi:hypothetical protein
MAMLKISFFSINIPEMFKTGLWIRIDFNPDSDTGTDPAFLLDPQSNGIWISNADPDPQQHLTRQVINSTSTVVVCTISFFLI